MNEDIPQWKPWYRIPFFGLFAGGAAMAIYGAIVFISLCKEIKMYAPEIVVETAMSAFPPLGVAVMAIGAMGLLPRKPDGSGVRPLTTKTGEERNPAFIAILIALAGMLLYPICGVALHVVTTKILTERGYTATTQRVNGVSGYMTSNWQRSIKHQDRANADNSQPL
ncbi:hypothetical protein [Sphingomonas sp. Leaf242]|uniref:hypothetical protein n=1 Tax=Sphingomonas sp. Leaf242 TaxID=1736304 RepID=UPI00071502DC|nr:hypothetical protein [Sphingomonas sp. Leaf242]KQO12972.1 hypothetical protein ASF09_01325 [Sphingomonas sp. Leaf242]